MKEKSLDRLQMMRYSLSTYLSTIEVVRLEVWSDPYLRSSLSSCYDSIEEASWALEAVLEALECEI